MSVPCLMPGRREKQPDTEFDEDSWSHEVTKLPLSVQTSGVTAGV